MARSALGALILALILAAMSTPALAHVHGISNAQCAPTGVLSGALQSADARGRPDFPIPQKASGREGTEWTGQGGVVVASGVHCQ